MASRRKEKRAPLPVHFAGPRGPPGGTPAAPAASRQHVRIAAAVLIAATLAAYSNSFDKAFVYDDKDSIVQNATVRLPFSLLRVLNPPRATTVEGRPIANLSFALCNLNRRLDVFYFHLGNLAVHVLAGLALFGLMRRTLLSPVLRSRFERHATWLALVTALLWLLHPLQTESVTYIIQRTEALMGLFYLLTLYCVARAAGVAQASSLHEKGRQDACATTAGRWQLAAVIACALGMGSKEVMISAPLLALLYDRTFVSGSFRGALRRRRGLYVGLAATWLILALCMAQAGSRGGTVGLGFARANLSPWQYAMTQCRIIVGDYLGRAFWPHPVLFDYGILDAGVPIIRSFGEWLPWGLPVLALGVGSLLAVRYRPVWGFLGVWFFVLLGPSSSFVPIVSEIAAEHRMYLPLAIVLALTVAGTYAAATGAGTDSRLHTTAIGVSPRLRWAGGVVLPAALAVVLGTLTFLRNRDYTDELTLWQVTLKHRPGNARAYVSVGAQLVGKGKPQEALPYMLKAVELYPGYGEGHLNLGTAYLKLREFGKAREHYEEALRLSRDYPEARIGLGSVSFEERKYEEARQHYESALRSKPDYADAHANLAATLTQLGKLDEALSHNREALRLRPEMAQWHANLGAILSHLKRYPEAVECYDKALQLDPGSVIAHSNLAFALIEMGRPEEAIEHCKAALRLQPEYAGARANLQRAEEELARRP